jgi:hypothetical protein
MLAGSLPFVLQWLFCSRSQLSVCVLPVHKCAGWCVVAPSKSQFIMMERELSTPWLIRNGKASHIIVDAAGRGLISSTQQHTVGTLRQHLQLLASRPSDRVRCGPEHPCAVVFNRTSRQTLTLTASDLRTRFLAVLPRPPFRRRWVHACR